MSEVPAYQRREAHLPRPGRRVKPTAARGIALVAALALAVPGVAASGRLLFLPSPEAAIAGPSGVASEDGFTDAYARLPLSFIPNAGHADPGVLYSAQGPGFGVSFTPKEALLSFVKDDRGHTLALRFQEASPEASLTARHPLPGVVNYLVGDPSEWRTGLPTYQQVLYRDLWPGVDAVFRGGEGSLKYEFHLAPGARVSDVRLGFRGADGLALGLGGELLVHTPLGTLRDASPLSYQPIGGRRVAVESRYVVGAEGSYGFAVGKGYDPRLPLVIDPELAYSTFLGGAFWDEGDGIEVDPAGHAYVTGMTVSLDFPTTPGAFDTTYNGGFDVFVTKLSRDGSALAYSTFLGGSNGEWGHSVAVEPAGHAYITGRTDSPDFPTTPGAFDTTYNGNWDGFVTKLSPDGSALAYSTFFGGQGSDHGEGIGLHLGLTTARHAYVTGATQSPDFPTTPGAFDRTHNGSGDAFVTKLSPDGSALAYSTFLGGTGHDVGLGIAVNPGGHAYVTGATWSPNFPTTPGAFDADFNGLYDGFVTKLSPDGSALVYSTYLGGDFSDVCGCDQGSGIAVDAGGHAYVTGQTASRDFPTTPGAFDPTLSGFDDGFVTKLSPDGSALTYSTYLGGGDQEWGSGIAVDRAGQAYVTGLTTSLDFPTTFEAFDRTFNGGSDAFVTKLSSHGSALAYSTFLGGTNRESGSGIGVDRAGNAYVTGFTSSPDFPTTPDAFDITHNGDNDAFASKFLIGDKARR